MSVVVGMFAMSCTTRIGDFTLLSTKNVSISEKYVKVGRFEDDDLAWLILIIPTGFPNIKNAVDNILDNNGGELVTNCVLSSYQASFILVTNYGYKIEGDVYKRASVGDLRDGKELFDLQVSPDGTQTLVNSKNSSERYTVTTPEMIEDMIKEVSH